MSSQYEITKTDDGIMLTVYEDWTVNTLSKSLPNLNKLIHSLANCKILFDLSRLKHVDSAAMLAFINLRNDLLAKGCQIEITGVQKDHHRMYKLLNQHVHPQKTQPGSGLSNYFVNKFTMLGENVVNVYLDIITFLNFIGESFVHLAYSVTHPSSLRFKPIIKNIEEAGVRALPIVALTSFLIGVVMAFQGAVQLEKFGAHIFIVDMIGISICRELAPMITAIVVAGRTGSSYTAQLGVMKLTEEIDAMRTMGFEPHRFLVLPRLFALIIALPLLIFFADLVGIAGGMLISKIHLNLSYSEFLNRLQQVLDQTHVWIGIGKGPFFAWLIATIGCFRGFQVSKDTESIGRYTTISVVNAIFLVIAMDAVFSVIFTELGI